MSQTARMKQKAREQIYRAQNRRGTITPRQRRRMIHKAHSALAKALRQP
jgi:hypothetical protein